MLSRKVARGFLSGFGSAGPSPERVGTPALSLKSLIAAGLSWAFSSLLRLAFLLVSGVWLSAARRATATLAASSASASLRTMFCRPRHNAMGETRKTKSSVKPINNTYTKTPTGRSTSASMARLSKSPITPPVAAEPRRSRPNSPANHNTISTAASFSATGKRLFSARKIATATYTATTGTTYTA